MIEAIYSAEFAANNQKFGTGIVVLDDGKLHGADGHYVYKGLYRMEDRSISASVVVDKYRTSPSAAMGPHTHYRVCLNGRSSTEDEFDLDLSGEIDGKPEHVLQIHMMKISDLVDQ